MKSYEVHVDGLAEAVAAAAPSDRHAGLLQAVKHMEGLEGLSEAFLATTRDGTWLSQRKVLSSAGAVLHDDHRVWLREELERDRGRADRTAERLAALDLRLSECQVMTLYVIVDRGGRQDNFVQIEIELHDERMDRRLLSPVGAGWWSPLAPTADLCELVERAEEGDRLDEAGRVPCGAPTYRLRRAVDAGAFVAEASAWDQADRARRRARVLHVTDDSTGLTRRVTAGELDPGGETYTSPGRRFFDDWALSSAGRSGARLCRHWALQMRDYTSSAGERSMTLIPLWTFARPLAEVTRKGAGSLHALYGKLETLDRRVGVPFGWYFYMLHGNRVRDWVGREVLEGVEAGHIVIPEHDYRILRRWMDAPYGF
jgi:hypothetical protein